MSQKSVLFIFTSADKALDGKPIGWYLPEAAHPAAVLRKQGFRLDSASPKGGVAPVDQSSAKTFTDDESVKFLNDPEQKKLYTETKKISEVKAADYDAIFCVGGHGPMIDLAFDQDLAKLAQDFYAAKKPVSAVCHGPGALVQTMKPGTSTSILSGILVTGFSNAEEAQTDYNDFVNTLPFSLEDKISQLGGKYEKAGDAWAPYVVYDGGVLTGQNPGSAKPLGERLADILLGEA